ncbi:MAG: hypothetical protein ACRC1Z_06255 [Waterburya sp.]
MVNINTNLPPSKLKQTKHHRVIEKTFNNNTDSDYTEKIRDLGNEFNYADNSNYYWSELELSLLYGTPLFDAASEAQKLALNHLSWVSNYNFILATEVQGRIYNMITNDVFRAVGGYETLCNEIDLETDQESYHFRTFQKVGLKTKMAIAGNSLLGNSLDDKSAQEKNDSWLEFLIPQPMRHYFIPVQGNSPFSCHRDIALKAIAKTMMRDKKQYYSAYLKNLEEKGEEIFTPVDGFGLGGRIGVARHWLEFFIMHWGMSPFMACQYYSARYMGNAMLNNQEYAYARYYRKLQQKGEYIPTPTAVSYNHLLDEAFHTTISQTLARETYKDFSKPSPYEKFISGQMIYKLQCTAFGGMSGIYPNRCSYDEPKLLAYYYKILKSPIFGMDTREALNWLEKCICQEHEGYQIGLKYHQSLLELLQKFLGRLDYQWKVNREMSVMAAGGSISKAVQINSQTFQQFAQFILAQEG